MSVQHDQEHATKDIEITISGAREPPFLAPLATILPGFDTTQHTLRTGEGNDASAVEREEPPGFWELPRLHVTTRGFTYHVTEPARDIKAYVSRDLDVARLNRVYSHLWWAGRPVPPRPLHRYRLMKLSIMTVEQADLHLVWSMQNIFLKPLPPYLLDRSLWTRYICNQDDDNNDSSNDGQSGETYKSACGFLLSYVWLIQSRSDFEVAKNASLLPEGLTWRGWQVLVDSLVDVPQSLPNTTYISDRYKYGNLRLSRLDHIYRFLPRFYLRYFMDGYIQSYTSYGGFIKREFAWIVAAFAYISVVLTALQLGLQTKSLSDDEVMNSVARGVTVAALLLPALVMGVTVWLYICVWVLNLSVAGFHRFTRHHGQ